MINNKNDTEYSVIGKWTEIDGNEEWEVLHNGPITHEEAVEIAAKAFIFWETNVTPERKHLPHTEIILPYKALQKKLRDEGYI